MNIRRCIPLLLLALFAFVGCRAALAQDQNANAEVRRLEAILGVLNQELKSNFDQMQALQQAARASSVQPSLGQGRSPDILSYDEVAASERRAAQRDASISDQLDAVLQRIQALEARKQPILARLLELSTTTALTAPAGAASGPLAPPAAPVTGASPTTASSPATTTSPASPISSSMPSVSPLSPASRTPAVPPLVPNP